MAKIKDSFPAASKIAQITSRVARLGQLPDANMAQRIATMGQLPITQIAERAAMLGTPPIQTAFEQATSMGQLITSQAAQRAAMLGSLQTHMAYQPAVTIGQMPISRIEPPAWAGIMHGIEAQNRAVQIQSLFNAAPGWRYSVLSTIGLFPNGIQIPDSSVFSLCSSIMQSVSFPYLIGTEERYVDDWWDEYSEILLKELYDAKWFPFIAYDLAIPTLKDLNQIIQHTRKSKNRVRKLDHYIFACYDTECMKHLRKAWMEMDYLSYGARRVICDALRAYRRREYSVPALMLPTFWEEIMRVKSPEIRRIIDSEKYKKKNEAKREAFSKLVAWNDYTELISDFYQEYIAYQCYSVESIKPDVPGRNAAAHGWVSDYPSRKAALNAILFTDFLLNLDEIVESAVAS